MSSSVESDMSMEPGTLFTFGELSLWLLVLVAVVTVLVVPSIVVMSTRQTCHRDNEAFRPKLPGDKSNTAKVLDATTSSNSKLE